MIRRVNFAAVALLCFVLTACATLGVPSPQTFNQKLGAAYATVTGARNTTETLFIAGKLSRDDAQQIELQLDNARTGLDVARQVHGTTPAAGDAKLDAIVAALTALQAYLSTRDVKP